MVLLSAMRFLFLLLPFALLASDMLAQDTPAAGVRVLLEDLHRQARDQERYNFAQGILARVLEDEGLQVESSHSIFKSPKELTPEALSKFDLIVMNGRYRPDFGAAFAPETIRAVREYVLAGGFLLVVASGGHVGDGDHFSFYNPLLKPFGVQFDVTQAMYGHAEVDPRSREHPLTKDMDFIRPLHGTTLTTSNPQAWILARLNKQPCLAFIPHGLGWVCVLGGGSGWMNQGMDPKIAKDKEGVAANQRLIRNLAT